MSSYNEFLSFPGEEEQDASPHRDEVNEMALRQALERLGKGQDRDKPSSQSPAPRRAPQPKRQQQRLPETGARRRKFVQDGDVRVEHQNISTRPTSTRTLHIQSDSNGEVEQLRNKLQIEQKLRETAERQRHEAQGNLRGLETRIGHAEIMLGEAKNTIAQKNEEILGLKTELYAAQAQIDRLKEENAAIRKARITAQPRRATVAVENVATEEDEDEPVKWWIRKK
ncbi:hypothetical protein IFJ82_05705 [Novacetimonas hansenii]|uniref:Uncharacterized protein n=2 Tax=Novacetimonas hansenii TaxID=436 RepID=A0AAW5EVF3_NOVHA|nr:hypothetical protein [Novacetimonas hansenii]EFG83587.1 hypothetical protein GXY_12408 [Novacetimonas hansenii ATCC 23769]MBL7235428.1 hypothetical protein [Novacetimonas hansenii]MCJ8354838.1 hypothetical protein [Novacetimonas hansenii]PYD72243.1 hypothetical protein CFR74_10745 [Novacetimonas hansenii]QOF96087.1 hypothetical protein IFJ82_05705 [Novacetimonas hansenii]